jgi:hypothetical protein
MEDVETSVSIGERGGDRSITGSVLTIVAISCRVTMLREQSEWTKWNN